MICSSDVPAAQVDMDDIWMVLVKIGMNDVVFRFAQGDKDVMLEESMLNCSSSNAIQKWMSWQ